MALLKKNSEAPKDLPTRGNYPQVELTKTLPSNLNALVIAVLQGEDELEIPGTSLLSESQLREVFEALTALSATGKAGEVTRIPAPKKSGAQLVVAVGLGNPEELDDEAVRRSAGIAARAVAGKGHVASSLSDFGLTPAIEGTLLGGYTNKGIRSAEENEDQAPAKVTFVHAEAKKLSDEIATARISAEAAILARDLVNSPANKLYPESYADFLVTEAKKVGLTTEVLDEKDLAEQGFGGIISVGQGSERPPRLVRLSWKPKKKSKNSVALVGKGITFDTGGISLKPGSGMWDMIMDMGGSAAVAGAIIAAARLELPLEITATLPLAENMPSGRATRPGDVITHYGGKTSEVLNTDAEGRLVLADAIARACEDDPDYLIETATLTGAQLIALGNRTAGVMGSDEFRDRIAEIGRSVGEQAWAMPLLEEHEESVKSKAADIRNINAQREGGMEYAATYLRQFINEGIEWAHIDVAGPAWNGSSARGYTVPRATGVPTRTIISALRQLATEK